MSVDVDIRNKCRSTCICSSTNAGLINVKTNTLRNAPDYDYCTHSFLTTRIANLNYGRQPLQIGNAGGSFSRFSTKHFMIQEITTYYHRADNSKKHRIKVPLILGIKSHSRAQYDWYENTGDGTTWKSITSTNNFPSSGAEPVDSKFKENLDRVACSLHNLHRVDISRNEKQNPYYCKICTKSKVNVNSLYSSHEIYYKFEHSPQDNGSYHVTHGNNLVKYKEPSEHNSKTWKLLSVNKNDSLSVYYWNGDEERKNPLLIELKFNGQSTWYENTGEYSTTRHNKWRKLDLIDTRYYNSSKPITGNLKAKLDYLSCTFNKTVRINLGRDSGCHDHTDSTHNNRIKAFHNVTVDTSLKLSAYEYTSKESDGRPFSVSEVLLKDNRQKIGSGNLLFKNVTKVLSYASFCDPTNPFLIRVEYNDHGSTKKWYRRKTDDTWEKHDDLSSQIRGIFNSVKEPFKIKECPKYNPPQEGIQINITEQPNDDTLSGTYNTTSGTQTGYIIINKDYAGINKGFFKITHKTTIGASFKLKRELAGKSMLGGSRGNISDVKEVDVYFWEGESRTPILVRVIKSGGDISYYGKGVDTGSGRTWMKDQVDKLTEQEALDHQNCQLNKAIPIELTKPENLEQFHNSKDKSTCLRENNLITQSLSRVTLPAGSDGIYIGKGYQLTGSRRISRVTYNYRPTNIVPPYKEEGHTLNSYYWKNDPSKVPLLVEFKGKDKSYWFENMGGGSEPYTNWENIGENVHKEFYKDRDPKLNEEFTKKIHEVNCRVHGVVQLDISKKHNRYCHSSPYTHTKKIKVTKEQTFKYSGFIGYEHTPVDPPKTLTISSIYNRNVKQKVHGNMFPLENVNKVTVYFPECNLDYPVAIRIEDIRGTEKWLKNKGGTSWTELDHGDNGATVTESIKKILEEVASGLGLCQGDQGSSGPVDALHSETDASDEDGFNGYPSILGTPAPKEAEAPPTEPAALSTSATITHVPGTPQKPHPGPSPNPSVTDPNGWKVITGISSGILGTSALACFAGYKFYTKYKGDPWVRQI